MILSRAIKLSPKNAGAYLSRGIVYAKLEQYEEAICDYTKAIELNPDDAKVYRPRSLAYAELGDNQGQRFLLPVFLAFHLRRYMQ